MSRFTKETAPRKGRPKGSPNRIRKGWKDSIQEVLELNGPEMDAWIQRAAKRNPLGAIAAMATLAEFTSPKQSRVTHVGDINEPIFFKQIEDDIPADPDEPIHPGTSAT